MTDVIRLLSDLVAIDSVNPELVPGGACPAWSPDGRSVAFLKLGELHLIPATGGSSRLLATRVGGCGTFAWSPDSKAIAFTPQRIAIVNVTSKRITRSASLGRLVGGLAWSPDGSKLYAPARPLAAEQASNNCTNLWQLDTKTRAVRAIVRGCP